MGNSVYASDSGGNLGHVPATAPTPTGVPDWPKHEILIVDDDECASDEMSQCLSAAGFPCSRVSNASEAFRFVRQHGSVAVIVTDIVMPGMDGLTFIKNLRLQSSARPAIKVVFVTGDRRLEYAVTAIDRQATAFLLKPLELTALRDAVRRAVTRYAEQMAEIKVNEQRESALHRVLEALNGLDYGRAGKTPEVPAKVAPRASTAAPAGGEKDLQARIKEIIRARNARSLFLDQALFSDPCWDMLLDLLAHRLADKTVSVSSLCIASGVPQTTALRRIDDLEKSGLVEKFPDQFDRRRVFVRLTDHALGKLENYIMSIDRVP